MYKCAVAEWEFMELIVKQLVYILLSVVDNNNTIISRMVAL